MTSITGSLLPALEAGVDGESFVSENADDIGFKLSSFFFFGMVILELPERFCATLCANGISSSLSSLEMEMLLRFSITIAAPTSLFLLSVSYLKIE